MELPEPLNQLLHRFDPMGSSASAQVSFLLQDPAVLNTFMQIGYSQLSHGTESLTPESAEEEASCEDEFPVYEPSGSEQSSRCVSGLRRMSRMIKELVLARPRITFKEVAASLTKELDSESAKGAKNVRRRVYDAINVLLAVNVLEKRQRLVWWKARVPATGDVARQVAAAKLRIAQKRATLQDLVRKFVALKHLFMRNAETPGRKAMKFPFFFVSTRDSLQNRVSVTYEVGGHKLAVKCKKPFQVFGDLDILLVLNLHVVDLQSFDKILPYPRLLQVLEKE